MTKVSQNDRVEAWLRAHGKTTIQDWDRQPAIDGGDKITRLARCIGDLRARGVPIPPSTLVPLGNTHVAEYRLDLSASPVTDGGSRPATRAPVSQAPPFGPAAVPLLDAARERLQRFDGCLFDPEQYQPSSAYGEAA